MINNTKTKIASYNSNRAVDICNQLIADFVSFYDGRLSDMKMIDASKLKRDDPPTPEQLGKCLGVARRAWHDFRRTASLPGECDGLLERKLKRQWESMIKTPKHGRAKKQ